MIKTYDDAIATVDEFDTKILEIDRALCRQGGHPDQANWVVDRDLFDQLVKLQTALRFVREYLERSKHKKEEKNGSK